MSHDKRKHIRTSLQCKIKISHADTGERIVKTRDVSDGGVFVVLDPDQIPPIGTIVTGQVQGLMDDAPILEMEVVRVEPSGIGLRFVNQKNEID
ncbi:MAG: PilZ domain-containing protein [Pseudomonadota bacterium]